MITEVRRARKRLLPTALLLFGLCFLAYLVLHFGLRELLALIAAADTRYLLAMTGFIVFGYWLRAYKWRVALGPGREAVRLFFLAKVAGNWTPGRFGELAPLLVGEHRNAKVAAWILADRAIEIWLTILFGLLGVLSVPEASRDWLPLSAAGLGAATVAVVAFIWMMPPPVRDSNHEKASRSWKLVRVLHEEFRQLGPRTPYLIGLTVVSKCTDFAAVMLMASAFGYIVDFWLVAAARFAHALVSASPLTPDTSGAPYVAAAAVFHQYAGMPYETLTAALALEAFVIMAVAHLSYFIAGAHKLGAAPKETSA